MVADRISLEWVGPNGTAYNLGTVTAGSRGYYALSGATGLGAAPRTIVADDSPRGGTTFRKAYVGPRRCVVPMMLEGATHTEYIALQRELAESFASTRWAGPGALRAYRPDGTVRQIYGYLESGWDPDEILPDLATVVPVLYCNDPFWRATSTTAIVQANATAGLNFLSPYPQVSSSQALGAGTVLNPGSAEAWPQWTITGPATLITITNTTTGESFQIDPNATGIAHGNLLAGETVTITTDPPSVLGPIGDVWTGAVNWPSAVLWSLQPSMTSSVNIVVAGAGTGTRVDGVFYARYETA